MLEIQTEDDDEIGVDGQWQKIRQSPCTMMEIQTDDDDEIGVDMDSRILPVRRDGHHVLDCRRNLVV